MADQPHIRASRDTAVEFEVSIAGTKVTGTGKLTANLGYDATTARVRVTKTSNSALLPVGSYKRAKITKILKK